MAGSALSKERLDGLHEILGRHAFGGAVPGLVAAVSRRGEWNGGMGTVWRNDPGEQMVAILMTNAMWSSPRPPAVVEDFLTGTYAAVEDR